jgi:hypothetical protein
MNTRAVLFTTVALLAKEKASESKAWWPPRVVPPNVLGVTRR